MITSIKDLEQERLLNQVLTLYYRESRSQADIGQRMGLSVPKVNRLIKQARERGWVEFNIRTPSQNIFDLERQIVAESGIQEAIVVPRWAENPESRLASVGQAAAELLLKHLQVGDPICIGGGRGVAALVRNIETRQTYNVQVVPALGGVQGRFNTDVNNLAVEMAERLGGSALQLYAPAFCDSAEDCTTLSNMRQVKEVLDRARKARIAVVGLGTLHPVDSSFLQFTSLNPTDLQRIIEGDKGVGEILAQVIGRDGAICAPEYASRVVGISLTDLLAVPKRIGIAALDNKASAVAAALKGGYLTSIVMEDSTAKQVLDLYRRG